MWPGPLSDTPLQARSGELALLRTLREPGFAGAVHSVFQRVINVQREGGGLWTIAGRGLDDAPDTLVVDAGAFSRVAVAPGDAVVALAGSVALGGRMQIRLDGASGWEPRLPPYPLRDERLRRNLGHVRARLRSPCLRGAACGDGLPDLPRGMAALLQREAALLCAALGRGDVDSACTAACGLVGLGPGLTPSGDDFLVGLFAALRLPGAPCADAASVCGAVLCDLDRRTNAISAAALRAAAQGRVRASLQALLRQLLEGHDAGVDRALARVLAIGSTSGADLAAGIVCGLEVQLQLAASMRCQALPDAALLEAAAAT